MVMGENKSLLICLMLFLFPYPLIFFLVDFYEFLRDNFFWGSPNLSYFAVDNNGSPLVTCLLRMTPSVSESNNTFNL